jgi:hypothetical protein
MGANNSSTSRVVPVFDRLIRLDSAGRSWLNRLLRLGHRSAEIALPNDVGALDPARGPTWGEKEKPLQPPVGLLEWLVRNVPDELIERSTGSTETKQKRRALADGDPATIEEAFRRLRAGERGRRWFVLEGASYPDAFLETERIVLVVEGKRTERSTTTKTTWMPKRSQMLRHMDAALEIAKGRPVFGLFLLEGERSDPLVVPDAWRRACDETCDRLTLEESLPHRSEAERAKIAGGVLGAATWQRVCADFGLPWPPEVELTEVSVTL